MQLTSYKSFGYFCATLFAVCSISCSVAAQDEVVIKNADHPRRTTSIKGLILDYTGREVIVRIATGRERTIPTSSVAVVLPGLTPQIEAADALYEEGRYAEAYEAYTKATADVRRVWVQRRILAKMSRCLHNEGKIALAGNAFLRVIQSDSKSPYVGAMPLNWANERPNSETIAAAKGWLKSDNEFGQLLGVSWLQLTVHQAETNDVLRQLTSSKDIRISVLAEAHQWRLTQITSTQADADRWSEKISQLPDGLRGGPYYLLGRTLLRLKKNEEGTIALMRAPVMYGDHQAMAADALRLTAGALEKDGDVKAAASLYREIMRRYKTSPLAAEAAQHIKRIDGG